VRTGSISRSDSADACSKSAALALHEVLIQELKHRYNAPRVRTSIIWCVRGLLSALTSQPHQG